MNPKNFNGPSMSFVRTTQMRSLRLRSLAPGLALALFVFSSAPSYADDTEIFMVQPATNTQPNILLVLDTSGSMNETADESPLPYDPTKSYDNSGTNCDNTKVYYYSSTSPPSGAPTRCDASGVASFPLSDLKCKGALTAMKFGAADAGAGFYSDNFIRWGGSGSSRSWYNVLNPSSNPSTVECFGDKGIHGVDDASAAKWPQSGTASNTTGRFTSTETNMFWSNTNKGVTKTLYSPNYIRYMRNGAVAKQTRMEIVRAAAASFVNSLPNVNVGVMRYSTNEATYVNQDSAAAGGMVVSAISPLDAKRAALIADLTDTSGKHLFLPHGWTPMSETLFEAWRYYSGGEVLYGKNDSYNQAWKKTGSGICTRVDSAAGSTGTCRSSSDMKNFPSVAESRNGNRYVSPATEACQENYVVFLTDGLPTRDTQANALIKALPEFNTVVEAGCESNGDGGCLGALAEYMWEKGVPAGGKVKTFFIGFGSDFDGNLEGAFEYLDRAANRGGGSAYQANDFSSLTAVFNSIIGSILQTSTTFTTPTVAVNAFNRTQTLNDLFVSVFQPNTTVHWPGNLKKYRVVEGVIQDSKSTSAIDPNTGFFAEGSQSFWSQSPDGARVADGGAAHKIPAPGDRKLLTYMGPNKPSSPVTLSGTNHQIATTNTSLTDTVLQLGAGDPTRENLIAWARGLDIKDENGDTLNTDTRAVMGDPIHSPPAVVIYGGDPDNKDLNDAVVYLTTNDGYLHAVDADTGVELWAFVPQEFLGHLRELYADTPVNAKQYTLDGEIRVLKYDINGDGVVDPSSGDRVILYFGTGRGGSRYYAIDVSTKTTPKFLWSLGASDLIGLGQAWSTPAIARVSVSGKKQNTQKLSLIFGGGYDPAQDAAAEFRTGDNVGNKIFMVDAVNGDLLWSAGPSAASLNLPRMTHSIPGGIAVLDMDSDGFADRLYAGDMAGQVWRFDITNGNPAETLVAGGAIASLGAKELPSTASAQLKTQENRRFYSRPDVAALQRPGQPPILNIAIGSGFRGSPLNTATQDRFYSIRDLQGFAKLTQAQYDEKAKPDNIVEDADLLDITNDLTPSISPDSPGWKLLLNRPSWAGEKSLSASSTFDNKIFFTTYIPPTSSEVDENTCSRKSTGSNRAYVVNALTGAPVRRDGETPGSADDRYQELAQGGIAPEISFLFPGSDESDPDGEGDPEAPPPGDPVVCLSGVEVLNVCTNFNSRIKTYWRESSAN